ncbi:MAG: alpha-2-macroglobulin family protein [Fimbriimonas sp.]
MSGFVGVSKRGAALAAGLVFCCFLLGYGVTQEVPLGQLGGRVLMAENDKPLPEALVTFTPMSEIDKDVIRPRYTYTKADGSFAIHSVPVGAYEMEVSAEHHTLKTRYVWVEEGKLTDLAAIKMAPSEPYLNLYASQRVFVPGEKPHVELHGFGTKDAVKVEILKLNLEAVARSGGLQDALYPLRDAEKIDKKMATSVKVTDHAVTKRDIEGAFIEEIKLPVLAEGFYFIRVSSGKQKAATYLNITRIAMITKSAGGQSLGYVTDLMAGTPISGADVFVVEGAKLAKRAATNAEGLAEVQMPAKQEKPLLLAKKGNSFAMVGFYGGNQQDGPYKVYTYTDRPVYRPGDEISFKGIVRKVDGSRYSLPEGQSATVELRNGDGDTVETVTLPLSEHGSYYGSFKTSSEAEPGDWWIKTRVAKQDSEQYVSVAAYRKPEYSITVKGTEPYFILGKKASAKVKAEYYFGGPVIGATVEATVYRSPIWSFEGDDEEDWGQEGFVGGEFSEEITATTDANGEALIEFDTRAEGDPESYPTDFRYTVVASVADEGDKRFDGEGDVTVVRGAIALSVETDHYVVDVGEAFDVSVDARSHEDQPLPGRALEVVLGREEWTRRTSIFVPLETKKAVSDEHGNARVSFSAAKAGSYKVLVKADDGDGNVVNSATTIWVDGSGAVWEPDQGTFRMTPDSKTYKSGDRAKVLLQTSKPGGSAIVTVEADKVLWRQVVKLDDNSTTVEMPIEIEYAPNAFVTAAYIKDKMYMSDSKQIKVDRPDRLLTVSVTPGKDSYGPGELVELAVETKDDKGAPAPAEVSVGVVDESIYAIRKDQTDVVAGLYPRRYNRVDTSYSFPDIYLDGGDKGGNIPLRTKFKDTAFWQPAVQTDSSGKARISFKLPDNLTEWRATVVGVTDKSVAGMSTAKFKARKDLMVRLQPPVYMVRTDTQQMAVIVTNDTGKDQDVHLRVESDGITLEGEKERVVRVAAGKPEAIDFTLVADRAGEATLTARAWVDGGASDGVEQKLPVKPYGRPLVEERAGETTTVANETVRLVAGADPNVGQLTITMTPSLAAGLIQTLPGLVDYPYGCVEQTMSRFMPSMVVASTLKNLGLSMPDVEAKLPRIVDESYARLAKMQHSDGGWGWWENDGSEPFMTALVLDGVDRARRAGFGPKYIDVKKALERAQAMLKTAPKEQYQREAWNRDRFYLGFVLARHGVTAPAMKLMAMKVLPNGLGATDFAFLSLAGHEVGDSNLSMNVLRSLKFIAQDGPSVASWAPQSYSWGAEPTALSLMAFLASDPQNPIVPKAVRYLMLSRKTDGWTSTRDTSYSLLALSTYLTQHKEQLGGSSQVSVQVNGKSIGSYALTASDSASGVVKIPVKELKAGENQIRLTASSGRAFYSMRLEQFDQDADMAAVPGKGLRIERRYYLLEPQRMENGTMRLLPSKQPVTQVKSGDLVRVQLTINSDVPRQYVMVEDALPSNFRAMERENVGLDEWGWWWSKTVLRDDRITFFSDWMEKGEKKIEYTIRAEAPGSGFALPTRIENMYDPTQGASGAGAKLEVRG